MSVECIHGLAIRYDTAEHEKVLSDECKRNGPALVAEYRSQWQDAFTPLIGKDPNYAQWAEDFERLHRVYSVSLRYSHLDIAKLMAADKL